MELWYIINIFAQENTIRCDALYFSRKTNNQNTCRRDERVVEHLSSHACKVFISCMSEDRESFVFHKDWYYAIKKRSPQLRVEIYDAIMEKVFEGTQKELSDIASVVMDLISPQIDRDTEKWLDTREKRSLAGKKHKGNQYSKMEQTEHNETNGTVSVSVSDNVSVDNNSVILKEKSNTIVLDKKKKIEDAQKKFYNSLVPYVSIYGKEMIRAFYDYWTEPNKSKTKIRFQMERTWDLERRLARWEKNNKSNNNNYGRAKTNTEKFYESIAEANEFSKKLRERIGKPTELREGDSDEVW